MNPWRGAARLVRKVDIFLACRAKEACGARKAKPPLPRRESALARWDADKGDRTLRLDYELEERAIVLDVGGYLGQWASDMYAMHRCRVHVFEPVEEFAQGMEKRFSKNADIIVHRFGLAGRSGRRLLGVDADGSSVFKRGSKVVKVRMMSAAGFLNESAVGRVDVMKGNIEGGEYELLEHLITTGCILRIRNLQVQFHDFVPHAEQRMKAIQDCLRQTHYATYQYPFVWENWRLSEDR